MPDSATLGDSPSYMGLGATTGRLMVSAGRVAVANGVATVLLAAIAVITARALGPNGRGVLVLIATAVTFVMLVTSVGVPISARVMLGRGDRKAIIGQYLALGFVLSLAQVVLTMILVRLLLIHSGVQVTLWEDVLIGLYGGAYMGAYLLVHGLFGLGLNGHAASVQVAGALMQLLPVTGLAFAGVGSPWPYVGAMVVGALGQVIVSLAILATTRFLSWPSFSAAGWLTLLTRGIPAIGLSLGQAGTLRIDRILIGLFLTASPVGIYSVAATCTEVVWLVPSALSQVLFQKLASKSVDQRTANRARVASLACGLATAVVLFAIAPLVVNVLVGARFAEAVLPLRILLVAAVLLSSYQLDAYALAAHGRIGLAATGTLVGFGAVLFADLLLIPAYGIVGAAWASVIAYGVMAILVRILVRRGTKPAHDTAMSGT